MYFGAHSYLLFTMEHKFEIDCKEDPAQNATRASHGARPAKSRRKTARQKDSFRRSKKRRNAAAIADLLSDQLEKAEAYAVEPHEAKDRSVPVRVYGSDTMVPRRSYFALGELGEPDSSCGRKEDFKYVFNPEAIHRNYNTRNFHYEGCVLPGGRWGLHIDGKFKFGGKAVYIKQNLPCFARTSYLDVSDCGTILKVLPNAFTINYNSEHFKKIDVAASVKSCLAYLSVADSNLERFSKLVRGHYLKFRRPYMTLQSDIDAILLSDSFQNEWKARCEKLAKRKDQHWENRARMVCAEAGINYDKLMSNKFGWKRIINLPHFRRFWTGFIPAVAVTTLAAILPPIAIAGASVGLLSCLYLAYKEMTYDKQEELMKFHKSIVEPNRQPVMVPAAMVYLKEHTVEPQRIPSPVSGIVTTDYAQDNDGAWEEAEVEVYGSTIPGQKLYPAQNVQNMHAAVNIRLMQYKEPERKDVDGFVEMGKKFIDGLPSFDLVEPTSEEMSKYLVDKYGQKKGLVLTKLAMEEIRPKDLTSEIFVKKEVYVGKGADNFKPRVIWNRDAKLIAHFSHYFNQLGKQMKDLFNQNSNRYYTSGATPDRVAGFVERMYSECGHVYESDVSNWDGSLGSFMLELEEYFIRTKVNGLPEEFDKVLANWYVMKAKTKDGKVSVTAHHGRRSGDLWTSSFNSLLNIIISKWCFEMTKPDMIMVQGDDNVVGLTGYVDPAVVMERYKALGMKCEVIYRPSIEELTFCSGRIWTVAGTGRWGILPFRMLAKFGVNHKNLPKHLHKRLLYGISKSLLPVAGHVPIIGAILRTIIDDAANRGLTPYYDKSDLNPYKISGGPASFPAYDTYDQFHSIYGIDPMAAMEIEEEISCTLTLDSFPGVFELPSFVKGLEIDSGAEMKETNHRVTSGINWDDPVERYNQVVNIIPRQEEISKLQGAATFTQAMEQAYAHGMIERSLNPMAHNHPQLQMFFTALSWCSLELGVMAHSAYNRNALLYGLPPAAKKALKKKKQRNVANQRRRRRNGNNQLNSIAAMVAHPCDADPVQGLYTTSEGFITRLKTCITPDYATSGFEHGFFLLDLAFAGSNTNRHFNTIAFSAANETTAIENTNAAPLAASTTSTSLSGHTYRVGAGNFVKSSTVASYRVIGACVKVYSTRALSYLDGVVGTIENLTYDTILDHPPSVSSLFEQSVTTMRTPIEPFELVWRPSQASSKFKADHDSPLLMGNVGVSETVRTSYGASNPTTMMGFVFTGISNPGTLRFEIIQIIEWKPDLQSAINVGIPRQVTPPGYLSRVLSYLDDNYPGWTRKASQLASYGIQTMATRALSGAGFVMSRQNRPFIMYR